MAELSVYPPRLVLPDDFRSWWSLELQPWWRDIDSVGHVTAPSYVVMFEETMARFVAHCWAEEPWYVVASLAVDYGREIRMDDTPVTVHVRCDAAEGTRFTCQMVMTAADGELRAAARGYYAGWDQQGRRSRPLTDREISGLLRS